MTSAYHSGRAESCAHSVRTRHPVEGLLLGSITARRPASEMRATGTEIGPDVLERLKLLIAPLGTHKEAAEKIGIAYATLQRMLYGSSRLTAERLHRIGGALGVPAERIVAYLFQADAPPAAPDAHSVRNLRPAKARQAHSIRALVEDWSADAAARLRDAVAAFGKKQAAVAEMVPMSRTRLSGMLNGGITPSIFVLERLCEIIGADPDDIIDGINAPAAAPDIATAPDLSGVIASAQAFRVAIDALPVGRDIRNRLLAHLDAHVAAIHALAPEAGQ